MRFVGMPLPQPRGHVESLPVTLLRVWRGISPHEVLHTAPHHLVRSVVKVVLAATPQLPPFRVTSLLCVGGQHACERILLKRYTRRSRCAARCSAR